MTWAAGKAARNEHERHQHVAVVAQKIAQLVSGNVCQRLLVPAQVPREQPIGEQAHLETQQLLVIRGQQRDEPGAARLDPHQRFDRVRVECVGSSRATELRQVGRGPEVRQQQQLHVLRSNGGQINSGHLNSSRNWKKKWSNSDCHC